MACVHCSGVENLLEVKVVDIAKSLVEYEYVTLCEKCLSEDRLLCEHHGVSISYIDSNCSGYFYLDDDTAQAICLHCVADTGELTEPVVIKQVLDSAYSVLSHETLSYLSAGLPEQMEKDDSDFFLVMNLAIYVLLSERDFLQVITDHMPEVNRAIRNN